MDEEAQKTERYQQLEEEIKEEMDVAPEVTPQFPTLEQEKSSSIVTPAGARSMGKVVSMPVYSPIPLKVEDDATLRIEGARDDAGTLGTLVIDGATGGSESL